VSLEFLITSLIVIISPGTGVLYTLATGLSRGARASIVAAFGCTLGIVPHMAAAILGLAARRSNISASRISSTWPGARCASAARSRSSRNAARARRCR
jgi:threonine/homoserine/homoserine lactone efflux protein